MFVEIIRCLQDNFSYLLIDKKKNHACVIDPGESNPIIKFLEKNKIELKYILNTHHHFDHIGGNKDLKKRYNAQIVAFGKDNKIPEIDIGLEDEQIWKSGNFYAKIFHVPGHTKNHICFYFINEEIIFTGDTLFSYGCGRVFEGTHKQMFDSLNKIKSLPKKTLVYCGHEYTLQNLKFCLKYDLKNNQLKKKYLDIQSKLNKNLPSVPSSIGDEISFNIFLRAENLNAFSKLRDLKDNF